MSGSQANSGSARPRAHTIADCNTVRCGCVTFLALLLPFISVLPVTADDRQQPSQPAAEEGDIQLDGEMEVLELMDLEVPVVVTATRRAQKITSVPQAVSVITAEDIRRAGARSIPDALRLAAGMDVADLTYANAAVSPRGYHSVLASQTLILVDGRQLFDSLFGGTLWGSWPFQLENIERIEVIRGPGGVAWGANAVNGVINIITKDPVDQLGFTSITRGSTQGTFMEHLGYGVEDGDLRIRISGEYEASDGYPKGGSLLRRLEDDYKAGRLSVHGIYDASPNDTLTFSLGNSLIDGGYPPPPSGLDERRNSGSQATYLLGKWTHRCSDDEHYEWIAFVNDFHLSSGAPAIDYRYQQYALQFSHTFKPSDAHILTWGIDSRGDTLDATNADPFMLSKDYVSTGILGAYVQDEWGFAPRWTLSLGARLDYEFYGGFEPSARAALAYQMTDDSRIYGAVSRAFQMPAPGVRFLDIPQFNGLIRATGHRDLEAITVVGYEIGYRGRFFDRLEASATLFWHEHGSMTTLSPRLGPPGLMRMDFDNRAASSMIGVEVDARYALSENVTLLGNYTFQQLDWRSEASFHENETLSPPKHKFMVGTRYDASDDLHLSGHLYFMDAIVTPNPANPMVPRAVDSYFRLDLLAEYDLWEDRASISVGVHNLLDSEHYEGGTTFLNDAEVPRMIFAEFRLALE